MDKLQSNSDRHRKNITLTLINRLISFDKSTSIITSITQNVNLISGMFGTKKTVVNILFKKCRNAGCAKDINYTRWVK